MLNFNQSPASPIFGVLCLWLFKLPFQCSCFSLSAHSLSLSRIQFQASTSFSFNISKRLFNLGVVKWDLIQIVKSYQGYPQPWYDDDLIRVALACHKRNLVTGSWGCPVSFTRHLFGSTPNASKAMTDRGHGPWGTLTSLVSHSCHLSLQTLDGSAIVVFAARLTAWHPLPTSTA